MELRTLRYYLAICREGSITAAAEACHVAQPSLSRQIAQLERELGVTLMERGRHGVALTEEGELLRQRAEAIVELANKTEADVSSHGRELEGTIRVGCGDLASLEVLASYARTFRVEHPKVRVELGVAPSDQVIARMRAGLDDMGLLMEPVDLTGLDYVRMPCSEEWVALVRDDDPLAGKGSVTRADFAGRDLVLPSRLGARSELASWFGGDVRDLHACATANINAGAVALVATGVGIALVVRGSAVHLCNDLRAIPLDPPLAATSVLAWPSDAPAPECVRRFIKFVRTQ